MEHTRSLGAQKAAVFGRASWVVDSVQIILYGFCENPLEGLLIVVAGGSSAGRVVTRLLEDAIARQQLDSSVKCDLCPVKESFVSSDSIKGAQTRRDNSLVVDPRRLTIVRTCTCHQAVVEKPLRVTELTVFYPIRNQVCVLEEGGITWEIDGTSGRDQ